jgi:hypothetical protein
MRPLVFVLLLASSAALAQEPKDRFYLGTGVGNLGYSGRQKEIAFSDTSIGLDLYAGFRLRDNLALELSYRSFDAVDLKDIPGSGVARLDIASDWHTVTLGVSRQVSLHELFGWRRDWRVYGALGLYRSDVEQTALTRTANVTDRLTVDHSGVVLGTGVLYRLGRIDLRGHVSWFGVLDQNEAREAGIAVQLEF